MSDPAQPKSPDNTLRTSQKEVLRRLDEMNSALHGAREAIRRKSNPQMPAVVPPPPKDAA